MTRKTNPPTWGRRANNVPEVGWTGSSSCLDSGFAQRRTAHHREIWTKSQVRDWPFGPEIADSVRSEGVAGSGTVPNGATQYERSSEFRRQLR